MNPRTNLAYCFACDQEFDNNDVLITLGYDFLVAVELLEQWFHGADGLGALASIG